MIKREGKGRGGKGGEDEGRKHDEEREKRKILIFLVRNCGGNLC